MELDAFLADSADSAQGKIYALGIGWNAIMSGAFPFQQPRIALGVVVQVPYTETNETHTLQIFLEDEDGHRHQLASGISPDGLPVPLFEFSTEFAIGRPPQLPAGDAQAIPFAINFDQLRFERPGAFNWVITVPGATRRLPMRINRAS